MQRKNNNNGFIVLFFTIATTVAIGIIYFMNSLPVHEQDLSTVLLERLLESNMRTAFTVEDLHEKIWQQIETLQEEGDCEQKKILHCENVGSYAGLGSMMHRYGACMQVAFGLGRMFFIHQPEYEHFGGIFRWLKNESTRCGHIKDTYRASTSTCNMHDRSCYLDNGYEINNTYRVLEYNANMRFPAPRRIPGTVPLELQRQLNDIKVEDQHFWFTGQFLGYLLLRLKPEMMALIDSLRKDIGYRYPLISIHFRHGDKINKEGRLVKEEKFLSAADDYFKSFLPNIQKKEIYIASDDKDIVNVLKPKRRDYNFLHLPRAYLNKALHNYKKKNFPKETIESIIVDIHLLLYGNYTICTFTSNVCRLLLLLKLATPPYRVENRLASMDGPRKLRNYDWFGYSGPFGFNRYWTPVRSSSLDLTFFDGTQTIHYLPGMLFSCHGSSTIMTVNNTSYSVLYVTTKYLFKDTRTGYVFIKDIVKWPGRPSYHFYPDPD